LDFGSCGLSLYDIDFFLVFSLIFRGGKLLSSLKFKLFWQRLTFIVPTSTNSFLSRRANLTNVFVPSCGNAALHSQTNNLQSSAETHPRRPTPLTCASGNRCSHLSVDSLSLVPLCAYVHTHTHTHTHTRRCYQPSSALPALFSRPRVCDGVGGEVPPPTRTHHALGPTRAEAKKIIRGHVAPSERRERGLLTMNK
jgi:hypothetical protein